MMARFEGFSDIDRTVLAETLEDLIAAHGLFALVASLAPLKERRDHLRVDRSGRSVRRINTTNYPIDLRSLLDSGPQKVVLTSKVMIVTEPSGSPFTASANYVEGLNVLIGRRKTESIQPPTLTAWQFADGSNAEWGLSDPAEALTVVRDPLYTHESGRYIKYLQHALTSLSVQSPDEILPS